MVRTGQMSFMRPTAAPAGRIIRSATRRQIFGVKPGDTLLILGDEETGIIVTKPDVLRDAADDIFGKMEK